MRSWTRLGFFALLLGFVTVGDAFAVAPDADTAIVTRGAGRIRPNNGEWVATKTGARFGVGQLVQASGDEPLELTLPDGVKVTLEPGSVARMMPPGRLPTEHNGWTRGFHLQVDQGELDILMPLEPRGHRAFLVSTSSGTLTGWRGSVHLQVSAERTAATIYEGALVVGSNGQGFPVYEGAAIVMRKGQNPDRGTAIPAAPSFTSAVASFVIARTDAPGARGVSWAPIKGASQYRVELGTDASFSPPRLRTKTKTSDLPLPADLATEPRVFARVRAVSEDGIVGPWSQARTLRLVRIGLPPNTTVAKDGAYLLPRAGLVALDNPEGLEVAYEIVRREGPQFKTPLHFLAAPTRLRLDDADEKIIHLRDAALGETAQIVLARRTLRASIDLSPKNAVWPNNAIEAKVTVYDPTARLDATSEPLSIETSINIDPIQVSWTRNGNTLTARIPSRTSGGPWVVRVYARDARGEEIGGGFLEIASRGRN